MSQILLVLDLDETLVHATSPPLDRACDFETAHYYLYVRPGLSEFLEGVREDFEVAVWTSSSEDYAQRVIQEALPDGYPLSFVWCRERCTLRWNPETQERYWHKNVQKLKRRGYDLRRVLCVDDSPEKYERSYGNYIRVPEYCGDLEDDILPRLFTYLSVLRNVADVRRVEKRGWLSRTAGKSRSPASAESSP